MGKPEKASLHIALLLVGLMSLVTVSGRQAVLARGAAAVVGLPSPEEAPPAPATKAHFNTISTADGLPDEVVYAILQDRQGFMWFGTERGLARYDGYEFTVYQSDPGDPASLAHDIVYSLLETRNGDLWVGTGGGLDRFDPIAGTFAHYVTGWSVLGLYEDEQGLLWVGTVIGLTHLDPASPKPSVFVRGDLSDDPNSLSGYLVRAIVQDRTGLVWLGTGRAGYEPTASGLDRFDPSTGSFVHYRHDPADSNSLGSGNVWAIFQDRQGALWIGTEGGLNRLDPASGTFTRYQHNPDDPSSLANDEVSSVLEDSAGRLWIGTTAGLDQLDRGQNRFMHYRHDEADAKSLSGDVVYTIYEDRSGVVWAGTNAGISRYDETASQFAIYGNRPDSPYRLSDDVILAVAEDQRGALWLGTATGGLNRLDRDAGTVTIYRHDAADPASLSSDGVTTLYVDRAGDLWVGTDNRWLERFDPASGTFVHSWYVSAGLPQAIAEDRAGDLWIGTPNGLYRLDRATNAATHYRSTADPTLSSNYVTAIQELQDGRLLVGTAGGGVNVWDPATEEFSYYRHDPADPNSLASDAVYAFYEDPGAGTVWIGTWRGLDRVEVPSLTVRHYTETEGLFGNAVLGILADSAGILWLTTNRGLSRFDPATETFRNYGTQDGLPAARGTLPACTQTERGEILIGCSGGLIAFYPERIPENPVPPPVVVTAFSLFNEVMRRDLPPDELIRLSYQQNFLSFEFAALDYTSPEKNQYAYRLEGVDADWVQAGARRRADYPNLRPGNYVFRVKASNNSGVWNEQGTAVRISIGPPFWGTWWFRGISLLALIGAVLGAYRLRVRGMVARSRELERQVADRTVALSQANVLLEGEIAERQRTEEALAGERASAAVTAERNRLARELHDSATQSLYAVTLYADATTRLLSSGQNDAAIENLIKLRGTAKDALGEMRLLIFELRPPILIEQGLAAALGARLEAVEDRAGLKTELHVAGEGRPPPHVEEGLYRIAAEALNNALRHAQARSISVSLRFEPEATALEVADDGIGFDVTLAGKAGGLGLRGMAERAQQLAGTITVETRPGAGTRVKVMVPRESEQEEVPQ